jgi:ABC-type methionine transport system ATPase subunit
MQREPAFLQCLTVIENVAMPLVLRGIPVFQRNREAKEQLKALGLEYATHAYPSQLLAYEKRVASFAQALIAQPAILLVDDITAGLSEKETVQLTDLINDIGNSGGITIINFCTESDQNFIADKRFKLDHGKIREDRS